MFKKKIAVINGPNMNMIGSREPAFYGNMTWPDIQNKIIESTKGRSYEVVFYQSNSEGDIVDYIQANMHFLIGIVINPAAFTKTGYAVLEALRAAAIPYIEVHMSNIGARGGWHAESIFTESALGAIVGLKHHVYIHAVCAICEIMEVN